MKLTYQIFAGMPLHKTTSFKHLIVEVNDIEVNNEKFFYSYEYLGDYTFKQGDKVFLSLAELDGGGNENMLTVLEFTADKDARIDQDDALYVKFLKEEADVQTLPSWNVDNDI